MTDRGLPQSWDDVDFDNFSGDNFSFVSGIQQALLERLTIASYYKNFTSSIKDKIQHYANYTNGYLCSYDFLKDTVELMDYILGGNNPDNSCFLNPDNPISTVISSWTEGSKEYTTCDMTYVRMSSNDLNWRPEMRYKDALAEVGYGFPISAFYEVCLRLKAGLNMMYLVPAKGYFNNYSFEGQGGPAAEWDTAYNQNKSEWESSYQEQISDRSNESEIDRLWAYEFSRWSNSDYENGWAHYFIQSFNHCFTPNRLIAPKGMNPELHVGVVAYDLNYDVDDEYTFDAPYARLAFNDINCGQSESDEHLLNEEHRIVPYDRPEARRTTAADYGKDIYFGARYRILCYSNYKIEGGFRFFDPEF